MNTNQTPEVRESNYDLARGTRSSIRTSDCSCAKGLQHKGRIDRFGDRVFTRRCRASVRKVLVQGGGLMVCSADIVSGRKRLGVVTLGCDAAREEAYRGREVVR
ncbi:hypothetical protein E2562_026696 [Oryza meyeriana var. granulata]|uniref:Uncharacterized protein n=1 Tax=Oryza meyeriana var. granulata TaxID=110450 RepID=A0A6G1E2G0_9ORYZ|nr:hypothetical protein E2562_026696 [Oryza meyeriana var. granulata]